VHLFVGSRRVATSKRTGLGNTGGALTGSIASVTTYHSDQVGTNSVTTISTTSAQTVSKTYLDPFGEKKSGTGTEPRYLFTDQERDAESGLDYFGARFYDAWAGRFLEQDPELGGAEAGSTFERIEGDPRQHNAYSYVLNAPANIVDPTGRETYWFVTTVTANLSNGASVTMPLSSFSASAQAAIVQGTGGGAHAMSVAATGSSSATVPSSSINPSISLADTGSYASEGGGTEASQASKPGFTVSIGTGGGEIETGKTSEGKPHYTVTAAPVGGSAGAAVSESNPPGFNQARDSVEGSATVLTISLIGKASGEVGPAGLGTELNVGINLVMTPDGRITPVFFVDPGAGLSASPGTSAGFKFTGLAGVEIGVFKLGAGE
jgi:RHS repeat-associated protein